MKERIILAEICRKKMEPIKDNAKMRTTNGSLYTSKFSYRVDGGQNGVSRE